MNHKVLLADDSLTIQKVIKITLANQPYEIKDCSSEDELFSCLPEIKPEIVFLDFNLSESKSGYDLCSKIKKISPNSKVLLLLGTFDTLDETLFKKCGASDRVVKPFDSNKFISICKRLISESALKDSSSDIFETSLPSEKDLAFPDVISVEEKDELDQWEMNSNSKTELAETPSTIDKSLANPMKINQLQKEISDWGMSVPGVINKSSEEIDLPELPPVINLAKDAKLVDTKADTRFPSGQDLDYPDFEQPKKQHLSEVKTPSQLISIETFKEVPLELELEGNYVPDETDVKSIEAQIKDEVEVDLWKADEFEAIKEEVKHKIEEMKSDILVHENKENLFDEKMFEPLDKDEKQVQFSVSSNDELEELVKKYVKEYLDQMFKQSVERVTWEVIPDLAENLIKKELERITNKVIND
jgi:DNA-binding response OmpR family regulator